MCLTLTAGGKLIRTAGPSVQRPEQSDANVISAMDIGGGTGKSSTVSGWPGSSTVLGGVHPPPLAGLFSTFFAAGFREPFPAMVIRGSLLE